MNKIYIYQDHIRLVKFAGDVVIRHKNTVYCRQKCSSVTDTMLSQYISSTHQTH